MRSAERAGKSVVFYVTVADKDCDTLRGGVSHGKNEKCGEAAFLYLPHSVVVIHGESARNASDAGN